MKEYSIYDDICFELTNYETGEDPETTDEDWRDIFYHLLCRVQNAIDLGELRYNKIRLIMEGARTMLTNCRIQWIDDGSEMDVLISSNGYDEDNPREDDDEIFFYGLTRDELELGMNNCTTFEGEWRVLRIYG